VLRFPHPLSHALTCAFVAAVCLVASPVASAIAAPSSASEAQRQAAEAKAKLDAMQERMAVGMSAYERADDELANTRSQIAADTKRLAVVRASLVTGQRALTTQATFMYRTNGTGFVDVLLGSASFDQFASRLSVLRTIAADDAELVARLKRDREEAAAVLGRLRARAAKQEQLVRTIASRRNSMQNSIDEQEALIGSLSSQAAALLAAQEKAANAQSSASSVVPASSGKPEPMPSSGSVDLTKATVEGKSGTWWVMSGQPTEYSASGVKFSGKATQYSVAENGTGTASGRKLNDNELTCAHRTLAFGTRIAVKRGSRRIIVVVTDRGPYTAGRVIDLTKRGASLLGVDGVGSVECEVVRGK
jgi:peptidoglycan DL-endopeptidase CwlO